MSPKPAPVCDAHYSEKVLTIASAQEVLLQLPRNRFNFRFPATDDKGESQDSAQQEVSKTQAAPGYTLLLSQNLICLAVRMQDTGNADPLEAGSFHADLWKKDVSELFLAEDANSRYQEFNISPTGAYWQVCHSAYRVREPGTEIATAYVSTAVQQSDSERLLFLYIDRRALRVTTAFSQESKINCCCISGANPRSYWSSGYCSPEKPDFHLVTNWSQVRLIRLD